MFDDLFGSTNVDRFAPRDHKGEVLLVFPTAHETGIKTQNYGEKDAVRADITVLTGANKGAEYTDALLFNGRLIKATKPHVRTGKPVLAELVQQPTDLGQPAWAFDSTTAKVATVREDAIAIVQNRKAAKVETDMPF